MILKRNSVELLAPAGNWEALTAAVEAGADAVYLGGRRFNMRMHEGNMNFTDEQLAEAVAYAHAHGVRLYVTLNNLISDEEIPVLKEYLATLGRIKPDALLVQDFAVLQLIREMCLSLPLHASVMVNTHNIATAKKLKSYGITRVVVGREMPLAEIPYFKEQTGLEIEYFIHGDICVGESSQCIHSGVLFGQSGNRGRCLKPCRWPYDLIDEATGEDLGDENKRYLIAPKDMCMYRNLPELIQSGVYSFKIEGRMRPAPFVRRLVSIYRCAIDAYIADPSGYHVNEEDWKALYENRARDFTTHYAFGVPDTNYIGYSGKREPRFFSDAVKEAGFQDEILKAERPIEKPEAKAPRLSVRVGTKDAARAAIANGADAIYIGGEAFRPNLPWALDDYAKIISEAHEKHCKTILNTPRSTRQRECSELEQFLDDVQKFQPDGFLVSNLGALSIAKEHTDLPVQADHSFNLFNHIAAGFLQENGASMATASLELSFAQLREIAEAATLPIEAIVHGAYETMFSDCNFPAMALSEKTTCHHLTNPEFLDRRYALRDRAGEIHSLRIDQYGRNHLYFGKDLCLYPYLQKFWGLASWRIEAQEDAPELVGWLTHAYRAAIDAIAAGKNGFDANTFQEMQENGPRALGIGTYRFRQSRNAI